MIRSKKGQTLIEIVLAVSVVVIVVYALVYLATVAMRYAQSSLRRSEAIKLANAGMEAFRLERDAEGFNSACLQANPFTTYVIKSPGGGGPCFYLEYSSSGEEIITLSGINVKYRRTMRVEDLGSTDEKKIMVTVKWFEGSTERKVSMSSILTDWR